MILRKTKLIVYLAITFSFLASLSIFLYLRGISVSPTITQEPYKDIVVVASDVEAGVRLQEEHLQVLSWPERLVPPGSFQTSEDVIGKVVARDFISGEPVLDGHLAKDGATDGIASLTPPGMRAMTVRVSSDAMVKDFLQSNSRVDVLATVQTDRQGGYISKSILQNVRVLSVDNRAGSGGIGLGNKGSVTLLVTPEEAERLALAESQGILYLVLRNLTDQDPMATSGATISSLLDKESDRESDTKVANNASTPAKSDTNSAKPVKRQRIEPKVRIEVIRGMEREEMLFDNP